MPQGNSARVPQLLSPRAATAEARVPRAYAPKQEKPPQKETGTLQLESSPHLLKLEKALAQQR